MSRKNVLIAIGVVLVGAAVVGANLYFRREKGLDRDHRHDQDARPRGGRLGFRQDSAEAAGQDQRRHPGRVVDLAVNEGDRIRKGQFLLQIDPKSLSGARRRQQPPRCRRRERSLDQMRQAIETAQGAAGAGRADAGAPARSVGAAADHARGARQGGERREGRRVERCRSARSRSDAAGRAGSRRSARRSRARATT